ncbi:hypothetical protein AB595_18615 [Massilia sp. WF1]|uniref:hypothetical protein n=1 Tax=unclassified Massilia TaxID=2609279 RepID=UPI00064AFDD3|nr:MULTISPECIES: hypothetical protein [unclassified Massilia]ALK97986.1 hypothetical protein AM586_19075 [Massilia sp. WG5]KLU35424.1 hypothetical protein AB595_18615 [Massilia sp. WF1]
MRDKKDNATFDLPGFEPAAPSEALVPEPKRPTSRARRGTLKQEQIPLLNLDEADATGLPVWKSDPDLDLTGLPVWKPAA